MTHSPGDGLRVKICGLTTNEDARSAERLGADLLGVVLTPGFGRSVPVGSAGGVVAGTRVPRVAVLVDPSPEDAEAAATAIDATVLQLHGDEGPELVREIRSRGAWVLWKAVRARSLADVERVVESLGPQVDGILVEGWREGVVGGAGVVVDLDPVAVRGAIPGALDLILAGGLQPTTVSDAVARFRPDVVDVSSGVESTVGRKDAGLVEAFIAAAKGTRTTP